MRLRSRRVLRQFMAYNQIKTAYELARRAGLKPGTVGHLVAGRRNTCLPETAAAIEGALGVPHEFLFVAKMSPVSNDSRRTKVAA